MPGFLYFIPTQTCTGVAPKQEELAALGLTYAFEGRPHFTAIQQGGPGPGGRGSLLTCRRRFEGAGKIELVNQKWAKHPSGKFWVGRFIDLPLPTPHDLARAETLDGYPLELADGQRWQIPLARQYWDSSTPEQRGVTYRETLPQALGLTEEGHWVQEGPLPRYRRLHALAAAWNDYKRTPAEELDPEFVDHWNQYQTRVDAAVEVLATNYVVGPLELSTLFLGSLTYDLAEKILDLLIDEPEIERIKKKWLAEIQTARAEQTAATAGSASSPGPVAETNPITPPLPT